MRARVVWLAAVAVVAICVVVLLRDRRASSPAAQTTEPSVQPAAGAEESAGLLSDATDAPPAPRVELTDLVEPPVESRVPVGSSAPEQVDSAAVHGVLVDERTDEPVPFYLLAIESPKRREDVTTDADGRFASIEGFDAGTLEMKLIDHPRHGGHMGRANSSSIEHEHVLAQDAASSAEIRISVGPTYRFDVDFPAGLTAEDFFAELPRASLPQFPQQPGGWKHPWAGLTKTLDEQAPLRPGDPPWARFRSPYVDFAGLVARVGAPDSAPAEAERTYELLLCSRDGFWSGAAAVLSVVGIQKEPVRIEFSERGILRGSVHDESGRAVKEALVTLVTATPSQAKLPDPSTGSDFEFQWLVPGDYELCVEAQSYSALTRPVSIKSGKVETADVVLTSTVPLGSVSGSLRSRTGKLRSLRGIVSLQSLDDRAFFRIANVSTRRKGEEYVAPFVFEAVPQGRYELELNPLNNLRWSARRMEISAPAEGLEFVCEDDVPTFDLELRAIDAETGLAIDEKWSIVWLGDPAEDVRLDDDYETRLYKGIPEGELNWMLHARGYRLAWGDEHGLLEQDGRRVATALMTRGHGQAFLVTTPDREPLPGVIVRADGKPAGTTDARGFVALDLDERPEELAFDLPGWHVSWGSVDPSAENFGYGPETPVYLSRDE